MLASERKLGRLEEVLSGLCGFGVDIEDSTGTDSWRASKEVEETPMISIGLSGKSV